MFKKSLFLLGIALATVASSTQAKIGDLFADLVKAYGKPMFTQGASNCWFNRGWGIVAVLDTNNICQAQVYVKVKGTVITKAEAAKWTMPTSPFMCPTGRQSLNSPVLRLVVA
jgi:hypothetical protein